MSSSEWYFTNVSNRPSSEDPNPNGGGGLLVNILIIIIFFLILKNC
jgi:hypothetical protein